MAKGGKRNRNGAIPDPNSARSDARGYSLRALPSDGYSGPAPEFPLPKRMVMRWEFGEKGAKYQVVDSEATDVTRERELALWEWVWTIPQACAWSMPSESWRLPMIAMWVRTFVICESSDATAADKNSLHRFADQIGMTTAGLAEMGWAIKVDEVAEKRAEAEAGAENARKRSSRDRMKVVDGAG